MTQLQTHKTDFNQIRLVEDQVPALDAGDILVRIDRFSFTANNITYAVIGEKLRYWEFFPPAGEDAEGWGQIPVWGFATVTESQCDDIAVGERLFGYFPPANFVRMTPSRVMAGSFIDGVKHRQELPVGYNIYRRLSGETNYDPSFDTERMLLFPLFVTAFVLHDMLQSNQWYGAEQVIIGSASSKTSIGLAYAINESADKPKLVGLTSAGNLEQVEKLGLYDQVLCYEELSKIDAGLPAVIVDMSANGTIPRSAAHTPWRQHEVLLKCWPNPLGGVPPRGRIYCRAERNVFCPNLHSTASR